MPQYEEIIDGEKRLRIKVGVRCKEHPKGRIWKMDTLFGVEKGSKKANASERRLILEAEKEKTLIQEYGVFWSKLVYLYEKYAYKELRAGTWVQSEQTLEESLRSIRTWTKSWNNVLAAKIKSADITKLLHKMKNEGKASSTLSKMRGDIKKIFEYGMLNDHVNGLPRSPTIGVTIKSRKRKRTEILKTDEIKKLLICAKEYEPNWYYIWAFAIYLGARANELYALKWSDIDYENKLIHIQRGYVRKHRVYQDWTKNGDTRQVSICPPLMSIIGDLKAKCVLERQRKNNDYKESDFILPRPGMFQNWSQAEKLRNFCKEIGIPSICFHSLRACFATELLKRGVPPARVMRVGGWSSMKTMMIYVRLSGSDVKGTTDALNFREDVPNKTKEGHVLMSAVGAEFDTTGLGLPDVVKMSDFRK